MIRAGAVGALVLLLATAGAPGAQEASPGATPRVPRYRPVALIFEHLEGTVFRAPRGLYYDPWQDELFLADSGNGLIGIFSARGVPKFSFSVGSRGTSPLAVATDPEGNIYVLSAGSRSIEVFNYRGEPAREIDVAEAERVRVKPSSLGIGPDGHLYVTDTGAGRILVYRLDGTLARVIRGPGAGADRLQAPYDIAFDAEGNLYISDRDGIPVQVYDPSGRYLRGWGEHALGPSNFSTPSGISVDAEGKVLVADILRQDVKVFDAEGRFLANFGGFGPRPGDLAYPMDVAAGSNGRIYVVERLGLRIQVFCDVSRSNVEDCAEDMGAN